MSVRVVVTGANSYLGINLCKKLNDLGYKVLPVVRPGKNIGLDFVDSIYLPKAEKNWYEFFRSLKGDALIHLPAVNLPATTSTSIDNTISINVTFPVIATQAMQEDRVISDKPMPVILAGSYWQNANGLEDNPLNFYAASKSAAEILLEGIFNEGANIACRSLRFGDIYGPDDPRKKFIYEIINSFITQNKVEASSGTQEIDPLYIDDACEAIITVLCISFKSKKTFSRHSVSGGQVVKLKELDFMLELISGKVSTIEWGAASLAHSINRQVGVFDPLPGWSPKVQTVAGLSAVYNNLQKRLGKKVCL